MRPKDHLRILIISVLFAIPPPTCNYYSWLYKPFNEINMCLFIHFGVGARNAPTGNLANEMINKSYYKRLANPNMMCLYSSAKL